jgi:hypothetical protein
MKINLGFNAQVFTVISIWKPMPFVENGTEWYVFMYCKKIPSLQPVLLTDCFNHRMKINLGLNAQIFTVIWKLKLMPYVEYGTECYLRFLCTVTIVHSLQSVLLTDSALTTCPSVFRHQAKRRP